MENLGKEEENLQENAGKLKTVNGDGGSESPMKQPASVSGVSGEGVNIPSKEEEAVILNVQKDANANETLGDSKYDGDGTNSIPENQQQDEAKTDGSPEIRAEEKEMVDEEISEKEEVKPGLEAGNKTGTNWETQYEDGEESGTEEEQYTFRREVENFYKERNFEFKAPKFYKEDVNLLK